MSPARPNVILLADARRAATARTAEAPREHRTFDTELARALQDGEGWAERALLAQYGDHIERLLVRMLGAHPDLDDLVQEVFVRALDRIEELRDISALRAFLSGIAVFVAREAIRRRHRRRWLVFLPEEEVPEVSSPSATPEDRAAVRAFYGIIDRFAPDVRIAFTLRFVEGMELSDIAQTMGISLSTVKRRLKAGEEEFATRAKDSEVLADWFQEGSRWKTDER